ncbi:MAG TPA: nucleotidyl transferase AbiEii/AbiGii toxin family protein [Terriglobia bacterium]|nr:nucleotidyl transferase AbiEii/AbiGii toxin family protein [Terriglobia bacterium]
MDKIAMRPASDRRDLFSESASKLGMNPVIVEKDFWVCWILKRLFADPRLKEQIIFKGGTTLSKVYRLIERFSEDIDLILDWRLLGYGPPDGDDPYRDVPSKTQRSRYNQEINARAAEYIRATLLPQLNLLLGTVPGIAVSVDATDPHTVNVRYPASFAASYIRPEVRLEIGPLASWLPSGEHAIQPYAAEVFPDAFADARCPVVTIHAERTFWEKATILHQEAHRTGAIPARHSRHYYDVYKMAGSKIKDVAFSNLVLLMDVVAFKELFYYSSWARYDLAKPGSFRLSPTPGQVTALRRDYGEMRDMFYREPPDFATILAALGRLEEEINNLKR